MISKSGRGNDPVLCNSIINALSSKCYYRKQDFLRHIWHYCAPQKACPSPSVNEPIPPSYNPCHDPQPSPPTMNFCARYPMPVEYILEDATNTHTSFQKIRLPYQNMSRVP
ncbi:hypothetical protein PILCRDRAFT_818434 [Piloderma croceum F 1598]|uniref:Uncharacterized protein n=1 Tax=Piloderma croceum (strain F 1598) TaxID=765440 RepID=A0A0C3C3G6_PILCF|nr:hypothetical protein PILCRDRAFT_818434 [Piloderma croceum F 1598]